jgi:hypothetical protein
MTSESGGFELYLRESDDSDNHVRIDVVAYESLGAFRYRGSGSGGTSAETEKPVAVALSASKLYAYPQEELPPYTLVLPPERANAFNLELPSIREVSVVERY